ncbi:MAG: hypothetical protein EAY75_07385 [Bacteroidetes bacterium]|nr:MAG: hypothetical protein EAY75_07385 [Bacteroidota bacterium]
MAVCFKAISKCLRRIEAVLPINALRLGGPGMRRAWCPALAPARGAKRPGTVPLSSPYCGLDLHYCPWPQHKKVPRRLWLPRHVGCKLGNVADG